MSGVKWCVVSIMSIRRLVRAGGFCIGKNKFVRSLSTIVTFVFTSEKINCGSTGTRTLGLLLSLRVHGPLN